MNVKPGQMAIVIKANGVGNKIIGRIVSVVRLHHDAEVFTDITGTRRWAAEEDGELGWVCEADSPLPWAEAFFWQRPIADCMLRPISGIHDTEKTDQQQPIKEIA